MSRPIFSPHFAGAGAMRDLPREALILLIRGYKLLLSPFYTGSCRYVPSCSEYASIAIHDAADSTMIVSALLRRLLSMSSSG